jgi:hypothetical protein
MTHSLILTTLNCMLQNKTEFILRPKLETIYSVHLNVNTALSTSSRDDLHLRKTRQMSFLHIFIELTWMPSGHDSLVPLTACAKCSHNRFSLVKHLVLRCFSCLDCFPNPMTQASILPLESCIKVKGQVTMKLPRSIPVVGRFIPWVPIPTMLPHVELCKIWFGTWLSPVSLQQHVHLILNGTFDLWLVSIQELVIEENEMPLCHSIKCWLYRISVQRNGMRQP